MAQTAGEHLQELLAAIQSLPGSFARPPFLDVRSDTRALLIVRRRLPGELQLAVTVLVDSSQIAIEWLTYRFHLMDRQGQCLFRYDNAAHHSDLATFPDHKHEGPDERVVRSDKPSTEAVLAEVRRHLETA